jgi:hypothetical protein
MAGSKAPKLDWISKQAARSKEDTVLICVRGMYSDKNKRGVFDDALIWVQKSTGFVATYNGNADPSVYRKGYGKGKDKGIASLMPGIWRMKPGPHPLVGGYPAFRQHKPVTVKRDGNPDYLDTGMFGINCHRASRSGRTSSLGCLTVPWNDWDDYYATGMRLLKSSRQAEFDCILIERKDIV